MRLIIRLKKALPGTTSYPTCEVKKTYVLTVILSMRPFCTFKFAYMRIKYWLEHTYTLMNLVGPQKKSSTIWETPAALKIFPLSTVVHNLMFQNLTTATCSHWLPYIIILKMNFPNENLIDGDLEGELELFYRPLWCQTLLLKYIDQIF